MSLSVSPSKASILEQLRSDAPDSPLVDHLMNRLGEPSALASLLGPPQQAVRARAAHSRSASSDRSSAGSVQSPVRRVRAPHQPTTDERAAASLEELDVKIHSPKSISADFLTPPSVTGIDRADSADEEDGHESEGSGLSISSNKNSSGGRRKPESYVLVHNVAKRHNLGTLARSATAFGVTEVILVGRKDFNAFGSHGASLHLQFRHFHTLPEAALYLKAKDVDICGVEIVESAQPVHKHPFTRSTAFVLGNEGTGLSKKEMEICKFFVYIPQCGSGTASLNVTVAASIVLHHFSVWAGYAETGREGQKFVVAERPVRRTPRNVVEDPDAVQERRRLKAADGTEDWLICDGDDETDSSTTKSTESPDAFTVQFPPDKQKSGFLTALSALYL